MLALWTAQEQIQIEKHKFIKAFNGSLGYHEHNCYFEARNRFVKSKQL
jgi:hypothetical protein